MARTPTRLPSRSRRTAKRTSATPKARRNITTLKPRRTSATPKTRRITTLKAKRAIETPKATRSTARLTDSQAIDFNIGIGAFPTFAFGELSLNGDGLVFKAKGLPVVPPWAAMPLERIVQARVRPAGEADRRRAVWLMGALAVPPLGFLRLPWAQSFWKRAGEATLELVVQQGALRTRRIFFVQNPQSWVKAINAKLGTSKKLAKAA